MSKPNLKPVESEDTIEAAPTPTQTIKIAGLIFEAPAPYTEGHVLSAVEAKVLNTTFGENLRNNFAKQAKAVGETPTEAQIADLKVKFAEYAASYNFGAKKSRTLTPSDPVGKEAFRLAKAAVLAALRAKKIDLATLPEGKVDSLTKEVLEKDPKYREEAARRIEATKSIANTVLDGLL